MTKNKTQATELDPRAFIAAVRHPTRRGGWPPWVAIVVVALLVLAGCSAISGSDDTTPGLPEAAPSYAVGVVTEVFIDEQRPTKANGSEPALESRTLETQILYPAVTPIDPVDDEGPIASADPDLADGPYPLIVFSHGLGASPAAYTGLAQQWASAGYVVAAPAFPLTSGETPGGIDPGGYVDQPADVSFVISSVLATAKGDGPLAAMVDEESIGVAGHSLGGITTLGVTANTCCADERIDAAVVLAGDPLTFRDGEFDYEAAPPILLVHGTEDALVTYEASVDIFNASPAPKGIVTIEGGDHGAPVSPEAADFDVVVVATTGFFDGYLKDDTAALDALDGSGSGDTTVRFVNAGETDVTLPTTPTTVRDLVATASPSDGLVGGQTVTVEWTGFTPGEPVNIVQCADSEPGDAASCDLKTAQILQPNPTGAGSLPLEIVVGPVGIGTCDAQNQGCVIVVNAGGSLDPSASVRIPITIADS